MQTFAVLTLTLTLTLASVPQIRFESSVHYSYNLDNQIVIVHSSRDNEEGMHHALMRLEGTVGVTRVGIQDDLHLLTLKAGKLQVTQQLEPHWTNLVLPLHDLGLTNEHNIVVPFIMTPRGRIDIVSHPFMYNGVGVSKMESPLLLNMAKSILTLFVTSSAGNNCDCEWGEVSIWGQCFPEYVQVNSSRLEKTINNCVGKEGDHFWSNWNQFGVRYANVNIRKDLVNWSPFLEYHNVKCVQGLKPAGNESQVFQSVMCEEKALITDPIVTGKLTGLTARMTSSLTLTSELKETLPDPVTAYLQTLDTHDTIDLQITAKSLANLTIERLEKVNLTEFAEGQSVLEAVMTELVREKEQFPTGDPADSTYNDDVEAIHDTVVNSLCHFPDVDSVERMYSSLDSVNPEIREEYRVLLLEVLAGCGTPAAVEFTAKVIMSQSPENMTLPKSLGRKLFKSVTFSTSVPTESILHLVNNLVMFYQLNGAMSDFAIGMSAMASYGRRLCNVDLLACEQSLEQSEYGKSMLALVPTALSYPETWTLALETLRDQPVVNMKVFNDRLPLSKLTESVQGQRWKLLHVLEAMSPCNAEHNAFLTSVLDNDTETLSVRTKAYLKLSQVPGCITEADRKAIQAVIWRNPNSTLTAFISQHLVSIQVNKPDPGDYSSPFLEMSEALESIHVPFQKVSSLWTGYKDYYSVLNRYTGYHAQLAYSFGDKSVDLADFWMQGKFTFFHYGTAYDVFEVTLSGNGNKDHVSHASLLPFNGAEYRKLLSIGDLSYRVLGTRIPLTFDRLMTFMSSCEHANVNVIIEKLQEILFHELKSVLRFRSVTLLMSQATISGFPLNMEMHASLATLRSVSNNPDIAMNTTGDLPHDLWTKMINVITSVHGKMAFSVGDRASLTEIGSNVKITAEKKLSIGLAWSNKNNRMEIQIIFPRSEVTSVYWDINKQLFTSDGKVTKTNVGSSVCTMQGTEARKQCVDVPFSGFGLQTCESILLKETTCNSMFWQKWSLNMDSTDVISFVYNNASPSPSETNMGFSVSMGQVGQDNITRVAGVQFQSDSVKREHSLALELNWNRPIMGRKKHYVRMEFKDLTVTTVQPGSTLRHTLDVYVKEPQQQRPGIDLTDSEVKLGNGTFIFASNDTLEEIQIAVDTFGEARYFLTNFKFVQYWKGQGNNVSEVNQIDLMFGTWMQMKSKMMGNLEASVGGAIKGNKTAPNVLFGGAVKMNHDKYEMSYEMKVLKTKEDASGRLQEMESVDKTSFRTERSGSQGHQSEFWFTTTGKCILKMYDGDYELKTESQTVTSEQPTSPVTTALDFKLMKRAENSWDMNHNLVVVQQKNQHPGQVILKESVRGQWAPAGSYGTMQLEMPDLVVSKGRWEMKINESSRVECQFEAEVGKEKSHILYDAVYDISGDKVDGIETLNITGTAFKITGYSLTRVSVDNTQQTFALLTNQTWGETKVNAGARVSKLPNRTQDESAYQMSLGVTTTGRSPSDNLDMQCAGQWSHKTMGPQSGIVLMNGRSTLTQNERRYRTGLQVKTGYASSVIKNSTETEYVNQYILKSGTHYELTHEEDVLAQNRTDVHVALNGFENTTLVYNNISCFEVIKIGKVDVQKSGKETAHYEYLKALVVRPEGAGIVTSMSSDRVMVVVAVVLKLNREGGSHDLRVVSQVHPNTTSQSHHVEHKPIDTWIRSHAHLHRLRHRLNQSQQQQPHILT